MDHHKTVRHGIIFVGFASSLLLLTITLFVSISTARHAATVKATKALSTAQEPPQSDVALATEITPQDTKVLENIDNLFAYEEKLR